MKTSVSAETDKRDQIRSGQSRSPLRVAGIIFLLMLVIWFGQTKTGQNSWNEASRLATIESLAERGTWQIDQSPFAAVTKDKLLLNGHYYSEKPPLLQALAAIPYGLMHHWLGVELAVGSCRSHQICGYKWLTFIVIGLPSALMIALFYWSASRRLDSTAWALLMTGLFAFGTMVWPYSLVFNNHIPAAACLFAAFLLILAARHSSAGNNLKLFGAGLLAALATSFDLTVIFIAFVLFILVVIEQRRKAALFALGGLLPALLTIFFDYRISGSLLPPYFATEGYHYPGSPWETSVAAMSTPKNIWDYTFRSLIGDHGLFSHTPVLFLSIAGLIGVGRNRRHPLRLHAVLLTLGMGIYTFMILTRTDNFGGKAYGARFFIPLLPLLFYFMAFGLPVTWQSLRGKLVAVLLVGAILLSVGSAYQGVGNTWYRVKPLLYLQTRPFSPYLTACSNLDEGRCLDAVLDPCAPVNTGVAQRRFDLPAPMDHSVQANFSNKVLLLGYDLVTRRLEPGEALPVIVYWQSLQEMEENYTQFNHLLDDQGVQWGGYDRTPGERYLTSCWKPGEVVVDGYTLPVEAGAPDGIYRLHLGLYRERAGQVVPLALVQDGRPVDATSVSIGPIQVGDPPAGLVTADARPDHRLEADFGGVIRLQGFNLSRAENRVLVTLYWQSLARTETDYTVFLHVVNRAGQLVAQLDRPPAAGRYPTSLWDPGEIIPDELAVSLPEDSPTEQYSIIVGLYDFSSGARLAVDGHSGADSVTLTTLNSELP